LIRYGFAASLLAMAATGDGATPPAAPATAPPPRALALAPLVSGGPPQRIEVGGEAVTFPARDGREARRLVFASPFHAVLSTDGAFAGVHQRLRAPRSLAEPGEGSFELYSRDGTRLWSERHTLSWDGHAPRFAVSAGGVLARLSIDDGEVAFLSRRGRLLARTGVAAPGDTSLQGVWSPDGRFFALLAAEPGRDHSAVLVFNSEGRQFWRAPLDGRLANGLRFTPDGEGLLVGHYAASSDLLGATLFSTVLGTTRWTAEDAFILDQAAFSADGRRLLLSTASQRPGFALLDAATGAVLASRRLERQVQAAHLTGDGGTIQVLTGRSVLPRRGGPPVAPAIEAPELLVFDPAGGLLGAAPLAGVQAAPRQLSILPESSARLLAIQAGHDVLRYRIGSQGSPRR
jgi:hypothetical protein